MYYLDNDLQTERYAMSRDFEFIVQNDWPQALQTLQGLDGLQ